MNDQQMEQEIQAKGLNAPRVTPGAIEAEIASEHYFTAHDGVMGTHESNGGVVATMHPNTAENGRHATEKLRLLTFCVLVLRNGFTVTGESACASPENFDAEIGRKIARQNAVQKIWPLLGFRLRDQLDRNERSKPGLPALSEADARADVAGTPRPDNPGLNTNAA